MDREVVVELSPAAQRLALEVKVKAKQAGGVDGITTRVAGGSEQVDTKPGSTSACLSVAPLLGGCPHPSCGDLRGASLLPC